MKYFVILASVLSFADIALANLVRVPASGAAPVYHDDQLGPVYLAKDLTYDYFSSGNLGVRPMVYNGTRSVAGEFLPVGWIGNCTATAVGPTAIFTAAHCVRHGATVNFRPRFGGSFSAVCSRHSRVNTRSWYNDYALCRLTGGPFPKDMPIATFKRRTPPVGERMLLNGFGAPTVGTHQWGRANVSRYGSQDIITCGPANLGGGDSGGPFFEWNDDRSGRTQFQIVGVNSRGGGGCSLFNRINHSEFEQWANHWSDVLGHKLCGINLDCSDGISPEPEPEPEPNPPESCWDSYERFEFCLGTSGNAQCIKLADDLKACVN